ncbi:hypothetical protein VCRA219O19_10090 [Vibrio crassostreae]|nr:hypothetical protein VCRA219O19_10090 [Vibrio crassostreae]
MMMPLNLSSVNSTGDPLLFLIYRESSIGGAYNICRAYDTCMAGGIFFACKAGGYKQKLRLEA